MILIAKPRKFNTTKISGYTVSIHPSIYLSIHLSLHPSIHLSIYPSIYLSVYPSIHLSIYLSILLGGKIQVDTPVVLIVIQSCWFKSFICPSIPTCFCRFIPSLHLPIAPFQPFIPFSFHPSGCSLAIGGCSGGVFSDVCVRTRVMFLTPIYF